MSWVFCRCPTCHQPRKPGYRTLERAMYYNRRVSPREFIFEEKRRPSWFPPDGYRDWCPGGHE